jgi:hypothetical protein
LIRWLHNRHVEKVSVNDLLMRCSTGADGHFDWVAGLVFEIWRHPIHRAPHSAGRYESNRLRASEVRIG